MSRWRTHAEVVIATVIRAGLAGGASVAEIRRQVDDAYPFGPRAHHPYKIWLEVRSEAFAIHDLRTDAEKARAARRVAHKPAARRRRTPADYEGARADGLIR